MASNTEKTVDTIFGPFNNNLAKSLVKHYDAAIKEGRDTFMFHLESGEEHEMFTKLAGYLIEYLSNQGLL